MVIYKYYLKDTDGDTWENMTANVLADKPILREGFSSLDKGIDPSSLTVKLRMDSIAEASLFHVTPKQVRLYEDEVLIFEGYSSNSAAIDVGVRSDTVYVSIKFNSYSAAFKDVSFPDDLVYKNIKIYDPIDKEGSLIHKLFGVLISAIPEPFSSTLSGFEILGNVAPIRKRLPLVLLSKGDKIEKVLLDVLRQNGLGYYIRLTDIVLVRPYDQDREPATVVPIESIIENPSISQAPYVADKSLVVRLPKTIIEEHHQVYELNGQRNEDGSMMEYTFLEPGEYWPLDSDDQPTTLEAEYGTPLENDDIELVHSEDLSMQIIAKKGSEGIVTDATLTELESELKRTKAILQLRNTLGEDVSLYNILITAGSAYYRDWSNRFGDIDIEEPDKTVDGLFMPDSDSAKEFVRLFSAEILAEKTQVVFRTHLKLSPNQLISIPGLPYELLVRYKSRTLDDWDLTEYSCVAYNISDEDVANQVKINSDNRPRPGRNGDRVVIQYALGDENHPFVSVLGYDGKVVGYDGHPVGYGQWTTLPPTPEAGQYVWRREGRYTPPETRPSEWSVTRVTGIDGKDFLGIQIVAPTNNVLYTARGSLKTERIDIKVLLHNLDESLADSIQYALDGPGVLEPITDENDNPIPNQMMVSFIGVPYGEIPTNVVAVLGPYSSEITFTPLRQGVATVNKFGLVENLPLPDDVDGEPLVKGDYLLWGGGAEEPEVEYPDGLTKGEIYVYDGSAWRKSFDGDLVMTMFDSFAEIANDVDSQVIGNAIIKKLVSIDAFIKNLQAQNLVVGLGDGTAESGFRFRAMDRDGTPVVDVYDDDVKIFEIDPVSRNIMIGNYAGGSGILWNNAQKKLYVAGHVDAESGNIRGQLDTATLLTLYGGDTEYPKGNQTTINALLSSLIDTTPPNITTVATGTINGKQIQSVRYGDINVQYNRQSRSSHVIFNTYYYRYVSATISTVEIQFVMEDSTTYTYILRKIRAKCQWANSPPPYPDYLPPPASYTTMMAQDNYYYEDSHKNNNLLPSEYKESDFNGVLPLRAFPHPVMNLSVWEAMSERLFIKSLPSAKPSEINRVWNDNGTLKIVT